MSSACQDAQLLDRGLIIVDSMSRSPKYLGNNWGKKLSNFSCPQTDIFKKLTKFKRRQFYKKIPIYRRPAILNSSNLPKNVSSFVQHNPLIADYKYQFLLLEI